MSQSTTVRISAIALVAALTAGCGSSNQTNSDRHTNSYGQMRQQEAASERRDFIRDREKQLDQLENEIARMEARLAHEAQYVDAQQRAEWTQRLFELRQQQRTTRAELQRAQTATPEEWSEMRGTIGNTLDSMEVGVNKLGADMSSLFSSDDTKTTSRETRADVDLCELKVAGASAELVEQDQRLIVRLTSTDEGSVDELRTRADQLAAEHRSDSGSATSGSRNSSGASTPDAPSNGSASPQSSNLVENVSVENEQDGVRVIFTPAPGQRTALKQRLSNEVQQLQDQRC
jgi:hypothetical protein